MGFSAVEPTGRIQPDGQAPGILAGDSGLSLGKRSTVAGGRRLWLLHWSQPRMWTWCRLKARSNSLAMSFSSVLSFAEHTGQLRSRVPTRQYTHPWMCICLSLPPVIEGKAWVFMSSPFGSFVLQTGQTFGSPAAPRFRRLPPKPICRRIFVHCPERSLWPNHSRTIPRMIKTSICK